MAYRRYGGSSDVLGYLSGRYNRSDQMQDLLKQFAIVQQFKAQQKEREWTRGMEEQRFGLEKEQLESLKEYRTKKPDWYLQAEELVKSGQAPGLGLAIKMVKKIKTPEEELDFYEKQLKLQKKYALQKEGVTPEEKQLASTFGKHANLVGFATGRLKQHKKDLLAKTKKNSRLRPPLPPGVLTPEQELANINKLLEEMAKITSTSMASGRPLMPEYLEAIQRVNKAKSGDLKSGRLYEEIKARWASGLQRYEIGQKKQDAQGQWWEYIGNDKWRLTRQ